nr:nitronate monooxygenase [Quercus suber]
MAALAQDYPWTRAPLVAAAPMRLIALAPLAIATSAAGGLGFIGAGNDASKLADWIAEAKRLQAEQPPLAQVKDVVPVGVGFLLWAGDPLLADALPVLERDPPAAVWLFAPREPAQLERWTQDVRRVTHGKTKIWVQVGTVAAAGAAVAACQPDVLVVQGTDAGGHGLEKCAGIISLLPETQDAVAALCKAHGWREPHLVAAGGIMDGRGAAASVALGAAGVVLGTRYLASPEANIAQGYKDAVLQAADGGTTTERGKLYDSLRGTTDWPAEYGGRGVLNESWDDAKRGMSFEENKRLYDEAMKTGDEGWGVKARLTTYAGTGVGLVREVKGAAAVTTEVREDAKKILELARGRL